MDFPKGMNLVYQQASIKVPVPGVNYSSIEVSESISYLVSDVEYEASRTETADMLQFVITKRLKEAIEQYKEVTSER